MRLASNEVVHGRRLEDCRFTMVFAQSIGGVRLRKQSGSKLVRQTDRKKFRFMTYYNFK